MVLPNPKDTRLPGIVLPNKRIRVTDSGKNRILRIRDSDEAVLVFQRSILALLMLFELVERDYLCPEAHADNLMAAADCENRNLCCADELPKALDDLRVVKIKVAQRAA